MRSLAPLIWADLGQLSFMAPTGGIIDDQRFERMVKIEQSSSKLVWESTIEALEEKASVKSGRGQLASSWRRISDFTKLARSEAFRPVQQVWTQWKGRRTALRRWYFENAAVKEFFSDLYSSENYAVSVLLGGPPCQGFSRIGRGKIRSLNENGVQVHSDAKHGDSRNKLFEKYVLFVSALRPQLFVFENVQHFSSEVKTPSGVFLATETLADAINDLSTSTLSYNVSSRTIAANQHGIPQSRQRFFMVGVRSDLRGHFWFVCA